LLLSAVALCGVATLVFIACSSDKQGALLVAVETDLHVPDDIDGLGIEIAVDGSVKYSNVFRVDGNSDTIRLPASIAVLEPSSGAPAVTIRAVAFKGGKARVIRDAVTTVPHKRTALLRMPLRFLGLDDGVTGTVPVDLFMARRGLSFDSVRIEDDPPTGSLPSDLLQNLDARCSLTKGVTNIDGECVANGIDGSKLPDATDADLYPDGPDAQQKCFDTESCFTTTYATKIALDTKTCTFKAPADASHLNVAMMTSGQGFCVDGVSCLVPMNLDPEHGYWIDTDAGDGLVHLPQGVCDNHNGYVQGIFISGNPAWSPKSNAMQIDGAGAWCGADRSLEGGVVVDGAPSDAGTDAPTDAALDGDGSTLPAQETVATGIPGTVGLAVFNGQIFVGTTKQQLFWYDATTKSKITSATDIMSGTGVDASIINGLSLTADGINVVFEMFPAQTTAVDYTHGGTSLAQAGYFQANMTPYTILGNGLIGDAGFFAVNGASGTGPGQLQYFPTPLIIGSELLPSNPSNAPLGYFVRAYATNGSTLYGVWDDGAGRNYGADFVNPDQVNASWNPHGNWPGTTTALAVMMNPNVATDIRMVVGTVDAIKQTGTIFYTSASAGVDEMTVTHPLVASADIFRGDQQQQFNFATDSRGRVYYANNAGVIQYVDVFAATPTPQTWVTGVTNARAVAVDESTKPAYLYFTYDNGGTDSGVKRVLLP
jgi:hypothetical protein